MTSALIDRGGHRKISGGLTQPLLSFSVMPSLQFSQTPNGFLFLLGSLMRRVAIRCKAGFGSTDFSLCGFPLKRKSKSHWLNRLQKKAENCHSERRVCAKNPSWSFVLNRERFFASLRMTTKALFPQPVKPVLLGRAGPSLPLHAMERANVTNRILVSNSRY